jgi:hypothetical protein
MTATTGDRSRALTHIKENKMNKAIKVVATLRARGKITHRDFRQILQALSPTFDEESKTKEAR